MNQNARRCKYIGIDREYAIEDLAAFHGHLGPYVVLGYRIGRFARMHFCSDPFQMSAQVYCRGVPPESCLADGIQIGSGCTLGKRNIEVISSSEIRCVFVYADSRIIIRPKEIAFPPQGSGDDDLLVENLAVKMYKMPEEDLFIAERVE